MAGFQDAPLEEEPSADGDSPLTAPAAERALDGSLYPRSAFTSSPLRASFESVVEAVPRARPVAAATSPAVFGVPSDRASITRRFVAPGGVRLRDLVLRCAVRERGVGMGAARVTGR